MTAHRFNSFRLLSSSLRMSLVIASTSAVTTSSNWKTRKFEIFALHSHCLLSHDEDSGSATERRARLVQIRAWSLPIVIHRGKSLPVFRKPFPRNIIFSGERIIINPSIEWLPFACDHRRYARYLSTRQIILRSD